MGEWVEGTHHCCENKWAWCNRLFQKKIVQEQTLPTYLGTRPGTRRNLRDALVNRQRHCAIPRNVCSIAVYERRSRGENL